MGMGMGMGTAGVTVTVKVDADRSARSAQKKEPSARAGGRRAFFSDTFRAWRERA